MFEEPLLTGSLVILGVLCLNIAITEWLCRHTFCKHFGTALLVILVTAILANLKIIPTNSAEAPVYDWLMGDVAKLAIFWILLQVNLRELLKAGAPMIGMFLIGALGTFTGVMIGLFIVGGSTHFGDAYAGLGAMFTGTYIGGSVNFNAMAIEYDVSQESGLFTGAIAVDNIFTAIWMIVTIAVPRGLSWLKGHRSELGDSLATNEVITGVEQDTEVIHPLDLALIIALGAAGVTASQWLTDWVAQLTADGRQIKIPTMLVLTTIALVLAQFRFVQRMKGTRTLGMFAVYLFLATIGALCDLEALQSLGGLGLRLFFFVLIVIFIHGSLVFGLGKLFKVDHDVVAVASQANIGGGTSALALARSLGRADLVLPAILIGALGTGLGNFMGILAATVLMKMQTTGG